MIVNPFIKKRLLLNCWKGLNEKCCIITREKTIITVLQINIKRIMRIAIMFIGYEKYKIHGSAAINRQHRRLSEILFYTHIQIYTLDI